MAHVTFIHGIGNKPPADVLLQEWRTALLDDDGIDLDEAGVTTSMVYWADMRYPQPLPAGVATESLAGVAVHAPGDPTWVAELPPDERRFVESLAATLNVQPAAVAVGEAAGEAKVAAGAAAEALPFLPDPLKRALMGRFLKDVHDYLYDTPFSPRAGETFQTRRDIRARAVDAFTKANGDPGPHVVVAHSLGTVIGYDVLTAVDDSPPVDALLTIGSPLGISEIQEALTPPWTRGTGWPERCLGNGRWWNVADRLDVVAGPDPCIANDFCRNGVRTVHDNLVHNSGAWRHDAIKYLRQPVVRQTLRQALGPGLF